MTSAELSRAPLSTRRALLLTLLTGVLLAACQVDQPYLAWVALAPLTVGCAGRSVRSGLVLGFVSGLLAGAALYGVATYGLLTYGMLVVFCGVHMAGYGAIQARLFGRVHPLLDLLLPALAWTGFEYLRRVGPVSFPITLSATQVELLPLLQLARLTGGHGVSFLIALPAGLLAGWAWRRRLPRYQAAAVAAVLAAAVGGGAWWMQTADLAGPKVRVAGVQTGFQNWLYRYEPVVPEYRDLLHRALYELTERAGRRGAQLIVWPETALHERVLENPTRTREITELARSQDAEVLAGFFRENDLGLEHNSAVLFSGQGVRGIYDKRRLAGLSEWRITPGATLAPLASAVGPLGVLICLESVYPQDARELVRQGAELLAVTTNDAGFLFSPMAGFHGQRSVLTAIESDRYLLHLSQAGPSTLLDPLGRPVASRGMFAAGVLVGDAARRTTRTPYHRLGDWFAGLVWLGLGVALAGASWGSWRRRRR